MRRICDIFSLTSMQITQQYANEQILLESEISCQLIFLLPVPASRDHPSVPGEQNRTVENYWHEGLRASRQYFPTNIKCQKYVQVDFLFN